MHREARRELARQARAENTRVARTLGRELQQVPRENWPAVHAPPPGLLEVWTSATLVVQVYSVPGHPGVQRVSVQQVSDNALLRDASRGAAAKQRHTRPLSWDELQEVKHQIGRGLRYAVEVYPPDQNVICVAAMRHLWLVPHDTVPWAWSAAQPCQS